MGKSRAEVTAGRLAELNAYVPVRNLGGNPGQEITVDLIQGFQVRREFGYHSKVILLTTCRLLYSVACH